jgi:hypothetical protein
MLIVIRLGGPHITVCIFKLLMLIAERPGSVGFNVPWTTAAAAASRRGVSRSQGRGWGSAAEAGTMLPRRMIARIANTFRDFTVSFFQSCFST